MESMDEPRFSPRSSLNYFLGDIKPMDGRHGREILYLNSDITEALFLIGHLYPMHFKQESHDCIMKDWKNIFVANAIHRSIIFTSMT